MEISRHHVQEPPKWVLLTDAQDTHALKRSGDLFSTPLNEDAPGQTIALDWGIRDRKAACMVQFFASPKLNFIWESWCVHFVLICWLFSNWFRKNVKRAFDFWFALCGLPLLIPIMLFTAAAIRLDSPGPVFYCQERIGKWGRRFSCYKFRSMYINAEIRKAELMSLNEADEVVFKIKQDPRVTRVGRILRKLSIDELPQILNVIKGDMSIVGPRPPVPSEVEQYTFDTFRRLYTIPGITGLQQVSGRSDLSFKRWVEYDLEYIQTQSLKKDIEILLRTIPAVISGKGAY